MKLSRKSASKFYKGNKAIIWIVILTIITRLLVLIKKQPVVWDGAVYIGMARHIWTLGKQGLWETVRPIVMPTIFGIFHKTNIALFGRLLEILISAGVVILTYLIAKKHYDKRTGIMASIVVSFNALFFFWSYQHYTEIPTVFFALLVYYLLEKRKISAGWFAGLTMLTKYPAALLIIPAEILMFRKDWKETIKNLIKFNMPIIILVLLFFLFNQLKYGNFLLPIKIGLQSTGWGTSPLFFPSNNWMYLLTFLAFLNFVLIFLVLGIIDIIKKKNLKAIMHFLLPAILTFLFFQLIKLKEERYMLLIFPFLAIIAASKMTKKEIVIPTLIAFLVVNASMYIGLAKIQNTTAIEFYTQKIQGCQPNVASSNPLAVIEYKKVIPYYGSHAYEAVLREKPKCIFYSSCDFTGELQIPEGYKEIKQEKQGNCNMSIFSLA